jgi:uncharacterized protein (DUF1015 family)
MPAPISPSGTDQSACAATVVPAPAGLVLAPFRGLRYDPAGESGADIGPLTSPPYDVLDDAGVCELEQRHPHNIVRVILPRDEPNAPGSRYRRAARTLADWRRAGVLRPDAQPALYVYEESGGGHIQRGLLGAVGLTAPEAGIVLPHENTMAGPVADRLALTEAIAANSEPIFLVYDGGGAASAAVAAAGADGQPPLLVAHTEDGLTHRLWAITDSDQLAVIAADLHPRRAVIADGHHRYATYLRHQRDRHAAGAGPGPWDYGLTMLVDATMFGPHVQAIHRVVPSLPPAAAVAAAAEAFSVAPVSGSLPDVLDALHTARRTGPAFVVAGAQQAYLLTEPNPAALTAAVDPRRSAAWRSLDVTVAHSLLISRLWRLTDSEDVVEFRHDAAEAVAAAAAAGGTALLLAPTPVADVLAVAAVAERMPRKSTLFTPKPRTGIVLRAFADN